MIFKGSIDNYLDRPLRDLGEMKHWSAVKIDRKLATLDPVPTFVTEPRLHQKICFYLMIKLPCNMQLLDMGLGKTKLVLDAFRWFKAAGKHRRLLVLVPNVVNLEGWRMEIAKHAPDLSASYIEGSSADRAEALEDDSDLCLTTYSGLMHLVCSRVGNKKKKKMRIDDKKLAHVQSLFDCIVWDEINHLMNHMSLSFRIASRLGKPYTFRVGLTGTPLGRDPQVLWPQFYAVDRGEALGGTLGLYRQTFFTKKERFWGGADYLFKPKMTEQLRRLMAHSSIRYTSKECLDLPPKVLVERPIAMTDEAWAYYHAVLDRARKQVLVPGNELLDLEGTFVRLRQITSGFVSIDGKPSSLAENPKLDALMELIDGLPSDAKMVVFNEFIASGDRIVAALKERKIKSARLYSGTKNKREELRRFMEDESCRVFVVNSQSGAQGINLQANCRYVAFFESPVSPIVRQQAEARVHRQGQTGTVFIYDLFCRCTVDQKILRYLAEGKSLFDALVGQGIDLLDDRQRLIEKE